ncbi:hypothetical protein K402DRAFT_229863 [Aulographum hederae CBS 113979]|uniref:Uncharacterized protein n=1 Tax=Aulographum hederae CBS 113979 TaxID=1176131 RepID=A0A6G1HBT8_9PEZI|nr:hypothetical protein K402DRAFT_229863 [Aulographum hederae CBS 113979]
MSSHFFADVVECASCIHLDINVIPIGKVKVGQDPKQSLVPSRFLFGESKKRISFASCGAIPCEDLADWRVGKLRLAVVHLVKPQGDVLAKASSIEGPKTWQDELVDLGVDRGPNFLGLGPHDILESDVEARFDCFEVALFPLVAGMRDLQVVETVKDFQGRIEGRIEGRIIGVVLQSTSHGIRDLLAELSRTFLPVPFQFIVQPEDVAFLAVEWIDDVVIDGNKQILPFGVRKKATPFLEDSPTRSDFEIPVPIVVSMGAEHATSVIFIGRAPVRASGLGVLFLERLGSFGNFSSLTI